MNNLQAVHTTKLIFEDLSSICKCIFMNMLMNCSAIMVIYSMAKSML